MLFSALYQGIFAAAAAKPDPATGTVVAIGLSLVFGILVLLTVILTIEGKIFSSLDKRKKEKKTGNEEPVAPSPPPAGAATPPSAPAVQQGIPPEVVAAITAAVATIEGGKYTLRSVSATPKGRGQWGLAGVISYTEPF